MTPNPTALLELDILSWWHPGTGRGDGAAADAVVRKGPDGMPVLPGRTVKGLLRAAARLGVQAGCFEAEREARLFGSAIAGGEKVGEANRVRRLERARYRAFRGALRVDNGQLGRGAALRADWSRLGRAAEADDPVASGLVANLRRPFSSTRLDDRGMAANNTLRTIEVYVPMTLYVPLELPGATLEDWRALDLVARIFLRALGSRRTRGFGRCAARILDADGKSEVRVA